MNTTQNTDEVGEDILRLLRTIGRSVDIHSKTLASRFGITGPQLAVLLLLERGTRGAKEIAGEISLSPATVTGIVGRLQAKGLVERKRSGTDGRRVDISITESGRSVLRRAPPPLHASILSGLSELEDWELNQILSALQRLASFVRRDGPAAPRPDPALGEPV
jgi:DNA-binding MarR family transcriptional regulator